MKRIILNFLKYTFLFYLIKIIIFNLIYLKKKIIIK